MVCWSLYIFKSFFSAGNKLNSATPFLILIVKVSWLSENEKVTVWIISMAFSGFKFTGSDFIIASIGVALSWSGVALLLSALIINSSLNSAATVL